MTLFCHNEETIDNNYGGICLHNKKKVENRIIIGECNGESMKEYVVEVYPLKNGKYRVIARKFVEWFEERNEEKHILVKPELAD